MSDELKEYRDSVKGVLAAYDRGDLSFEEACQHHDSAAEVLRSHYLADGPPDEILKQQFKDFAAFQMMALERGDTDLNSVSVVVESCAYALFPDRVKANAMIAPVQAELMTLELDMADDTAPAARSAPPGFPPPEQTYG